jgi:GDP/UDP-N,N'-diacetylbacillosamine 2-epimerase (hydrolysing)
MKIAVLSSSRADYGIYLPLLKLIKESSNIELELVVFGTHLSKKHGYTVKNIIDDGFEIQHQIEIEFNGDSPKDISDHFGETVIKFSTFWQKYGNQYKWILTLGDRFEMAAAVAAGIPFNLPFVHIHSGETTLGATDNIYRHFITLASCKQFVSLEDYKQKVKEILGHNNNCEVVGSLSLDNLNQLKLLSLKEFKQKWDIDLNLKTILITVHPETVEFQENIKYAEVCFDTFKELADEYQLVITMPNADTFGNIYREVYNQLKALVPKKVFLIENFGTLSYFTAMKHSALMIGNTSSGIIEAASFEKFVLNLGDRQKGRLVGENVIQLPFDKKQVLFNVEKHIGLQYNKGNIYFKGGANQLILNHLN